jgi:hypothetical protein
MTMYLLNKEEIEKMSNRLLELIEQQEQLIDEIDEKIEDNEEVKKDDPFSREEYLNNEKQNQKTRVDE